MSVLGVTRGAVDVGAGLGRLVHSGVVDTDSTSDVQIITPLEEFFVNIAFLRPSFSSLL
jgi:hypothetical protein